MRHVEWNGIDIQQFLSGPKWGSMELHRVDDATRPTGGGVTATVNFQRASTSACRRVCEWEWWDPADDIYIDMWVSLEVT